MDYEISNAIATFLLLTRMASAALENADGELAQSIHNVTEKGLVAFDATGRIDQATADFVRANGDFLDGREPGRLTETEWLKSAQVTRDAMAAWDAAG